MDLFLHFFSGFIPFGFHEMKNDRHLRKDYYDEKIIIILSRNSGVVILVVFSGLEVLCF